MQLWLECIPFYHYNLSSNYKKQTKHFWSSCTSFALTLPTLHPFYFWSSCGCCNESYPLPHQLLRWNKIKNSLSFYLNTAKLFHLIWVITSKLCMNGNILKTNYPNLKCQNKTLEVNFYFHVPNLMLFIKLIIEQELPKGKFNWAATGRFFLRGGGSCTHSGYHKTLLPTIAWHRILRESEKCTLLEDFCNKKKWVPFLSWGCRVTFKFHYKIMNKNKQVSHSEWEIITVF